VGAENPNDSVALFSNTGPWVNCYEQGASLLSTMPPFQGGLLPAARTRAEGYVREALDPDDFRGGFALWSGTSFAAPLVAGRVAALLLEAGIPADRTEDTATAVARGRDAVGAAIRQAKQSTRAVRRGTSSARSRRQ
jgi:subtilisin family serine protease